MPSGPYPIIYEAGIFLANNYGVINKKIIMDPFFLIEIGVVAVIIALQVIVFLRNGASISKLGDTYPQGNLLKVKPVMTTPTEDGKPIADGTSVPTIDEAGPFTRVFREIINTTNTYLLRNKGAADFDIIKEVAESKVSSQENAIESNIPLPLYIGLLATFTGVIIGLIRIAFDGVSDDAIQAFIGGVLIGMIGSATGLALTVRSNIAFKEGKKLRDEKQYDYFTFLRANILPVKSKDPEQPVSALRDNLNAFNDGFARYQKNMNESLQETLRLFSELKDVFKQIRSIEQGLSGMGHFIQANDSLIEKQISYLDDYAHRAEAFTKKLNTHMTQVDRQVGTMVDENIRALENSTQAAYVKMDKYLASLEGTESKAFAEAPEQGSYLYSRRCEKPSGEKSGNQYPPAGSITDRRKRLAQ